MPGKPFYSMEEVCSKLGKSQDEVKALVRDGKLREFRDAGKVFFKADDIEKLAAAARAPAEDSGEILLEPVPDLTEPPAARSDTGLPGLADSSGGTSIIGLEPLGEEEPEKKEDTVITRSGIGVFDDDELEIADPMAKTQITEVASDQVSLEGAGSGSGLLDLAREADDTALGADLLDEIYPGEEGAPPAEEAAPPAKPAARAPTPPVPVAAQPEEATETDEPVMEEAGAGEVVMVPTAVGGDPAEGMFSGLLVGALILMGVAASVVGGAVQGFVPDYGRFLGDGSKFWFFLGGAVLTVGLALLVGWFVGKAMGPRAPRAPRTPKLARAK